MSLTAYPFGKVVLRSDFENGEDYRRYVRETPTAAQYAIQDRHPFLKSLEGCFPVQAMLPGWWKNVLVDESLSFEKRLLLNTVTGENFRDGKICEHRLKALRAVLDVEEKKTIPSSPSIAKWLQGTQWYDMYNDRGVKESSIELRITTRPEDIFYMSNGSGWSSCQHYRHGDMNSHLVGAMHEPYLAMAYLIGKDDTVGGGNTNRHGGTILARSLLRMVHIDGCDVPSVFIDRIYGTDSGTIDRFLLMISSHFKDRNISHCRSRSTYDYCESFFTSVPLFATPYSVGLSYLDSMSQHSSNTYGTATYYRLTCRAHFRTSDPALASLSDFEENDGYEHEDAQEDENIEENW